MCSYSSVEYEKKNTRKKSTDFKRFQRIYRLCRGVGEKADFQYFSIFYGKLCFWLYPYTLASTLPILHIFYIIFLLDLKRYIRHKIYMGGLGGKGGETVTAHQALTDTYTYILFKLAGSSTILPYILLQHHLR